MYMAEEQPICEIKECNNDAVRSIATKNLRKSLPKIKVEDEKKRRTHICKDHYKEFKKATKEERELQRLGW